MAMFSSYVSLPEGNQASIFADFPSYKLGDFPLS